MTVFKNIANLAVTGILLAGLMHPILPVNAEVLTKEDLKGLEQKIDHMREKIDNRFDRQENMFVTVPILSAAISGAASLYSGNKLDSAIRLFKDETENIKKDLYQGIDKKAFVAGQRGAFTALVVIAAIMITFSAAHN